jgi:hypothetical protein
MEGRIYHKQRIIRANSYVLWITKFTRHISSNDGRLFWDMIDEGWIAIYMDDILIHAKTKEDLEKGTK